MGFALELLEPNEPDIRSIREQLRGFLGKSTQPFCRRLWELLLSAQEDPQGIPAELIELKRKELEEQRVCVFVFLGVLLSDHVATTTSNPEQLL